MKRPGLALVTLLAALVLAAPASAALRYAAPDGNGAPPCASSDPCSLKTAIQTGSADGDEVIVASGNYTYDATIIMTKRLNVHGVAGQPRPRILPATGVNDQAFYLGPNPGDVKVRLARLEIRSAVIGVHTITDNATLEDLIVTVTGEQAAAITFEGQGDKLLRNSVARSTGAYGQGVYANDGAVHIRNVTAYSSGANSAGIWAQGNCYAMPGSPMCITPASHPDVEVVNTIAHGAAYDLISNAQPGATAKITIGHSNFAIMGPTTADATIVDAGGNQSEPPLYSKQLLGSFHQRSGSPTIDAGTDDPLNGETDWDGDPRKLGKATDIGVDELVALTRTDPGDPGTTDPGTTDPGSGDPGSGPADTVAPTLTDVAIAPEKFRAAAKGPSAAAAAKLGATVVFTVSEPAMVSFRVVRRLGGRKVGKRCVKPTRRNRKRGHCVRSVSVNGGFDRSGASGANGFKFSGRIADKRLKPGRYRLIGMAADAAGNLSKQSRAPFRIVRR